jgi:hypothetical protein
MVRVSIDLDSSQKEKLLQLKKLFGAASQAEVVRRLIMSTKISTGKEYSKGIITLEPVLDIKA